MAIIPLTVTIPGRQSLSNAVEYTDSHVVGVIMPSAWTTGAHVTVLVSLDGVDFFNLFSFSDLTSTTPTEFAFNVIPGAIVAVDPNRMLMGRFLKLRSGTRDVPVLTAATRVFTVITVPLLAD